VKGQLHLQLAYGHTSQVHLDTHTHTHTHTHTYSPSVCNVIRIVNLTNLVLRSLDLAINKSLHKTFHARRIFTV